jgi:hypothetical protein
MLSALMIFLIPSAHGDFGDISLTPPQMVTITGQELTSFQVGQQIGVESHLTNHANSEQKFTYIVEVSNKDGGIEYLEGFSASMVSNQTFTASQVWIPKQPGQYTVQVFVWNSLASAMPLTNVLETQITVNP